MAEKNQYWNQLISKGINYLQEQNNDNAVTVLKKAAFDLEHSYHDSWRWGTDYWVLILKLKYRDHMALGEKKEQVERDIMSALVKLQKGSKDLLSTVSIRQFAEKDLEREEDLAFRKAVEDADLFIREGSYDHAFDRIYAAFSDYIRHILTAHDVHFETDESVYALLVKLQGCYSSRIEPSEVGDRIKNLLLSTGELMDTINELRNSITAVHPDGQLIEKREAQLAMSMAGSIVDYIEDIEN